MLRISDFRLILLRLKRAPAASGVKSIKCASACKKDKNFRIFSNVSHYFSDIFKYFRKFSIVFKRFQTQLAHLVALF